VTKRYKAHDEKNEFKVGDKVLIQEIGPMSRGKRWAVTGIIKSASADKMEEVNQKSEE
jgi:small subunit ribosomal protein S17